MDERKRKNDIVWMKEKAKKERKKERKNIEWIKEKERIISFG